MRYRLYSNRWHLIKGDLCDLRRNFIPIEALEGYSGTIFAKISSWWSLRNRDQDEKTLNFVLVASKKWGPG